LTEIQTITSGLETVKKHLPGYFAGISGSSDRRCRSYNRKRIFINKAGKQVLYQFGSTLPAGQYNYTNPDGTRYMVNGAPGAINQADDAVLYGIHTKDHWGMG